MSKKTESKFDAYCKVLLRHKAVDAHRKRKRQTAATTVISALSQRELAQLCHYDDYKLDVQHFEVQGEDIEIRNERLYEALRELSGVQRDILLLAYCFELPDTEIAAMLSLPRSTVQYRRTSAMQYIRKKMEDET